MTKDPFSQFAQWFAAAKRCKAIEDPTAMCLSTLGADGFPNGRMVLLKNFDKHGFVFYTHLHSPKGQGLARTPRAALTFYWEGLKRQVRVQGKTQIVPDAEAEAYWITRPRISQLGAWASKQSEELPSRAILLKDVAALAIKYGTGPVPRPPYWTGIRVVPRSVEFWKAGINRLHDRFLYTRKGDGWQVRRLYP